MWNASVKMDVDGRPDSRRPPKDRRAFYAFTKPKRSSLLPSHKCHDPIVLIAAYPTVGIQYECRVSVDLPLQKLQSVISCSSLEIESEDGCGSRHILQGVLRLKLRHG